MNGIFIVVTVIGIILISIRNPDAVIGVMLEGGTNAIDLGIRLLAIYAVWMSVLNMLEKSGISKGLTGLFRPITDRLFKGESDKAKGYISVNLASNMLGLGGAATPAGINAIKAMDKDGTTATKNMVMLIVINATSLQLLPATVMAMMSSHGSERPSSIILPSLISTAISTGLGILMVSLKREK